MKNSQRVGLFVTCLVDLFRPSVGFAAVKLLEDAGYEVAVPAAQSCCGQPAYNSGDRANSRKIASQVIAAFADFPYVVAPSGSCAAMLSHHYPALFPEGSTEREAANRFAGKVFELVDFLTRIAGVDTVDSGFTGRVTYHDSCSGLRELGIHDQPRRLLQSMPGVELVEMEGSNVCCGFGGTFAVKYGEISDAIVSEKSRKIEAAEPELLLAGDLGCLMNMAGKLKRRGSAIQVRHLAEILAGMTDDPPIAEGR